MLNFYCVYHLNMMYSAIEVEQRPEVIRKCYWPLLELAQSGIPMGIEISGLSLEIIQRIDPQWVLTLQELITENKVELVGSGYAQIIGPIVPHEVNQWNQNLGLDLYQKILRRKPRIALVNEMAFSASMISHYKLAGYDAIVMEWNNPYRYHQEWKSEWRYHYQIAQGLGGDTIKVIWADSIAFQKFQRCTHQEVKIDDHINYLKTHDHESEGYYPLYTADAEIFNFRPNRYETEADLTGLVDWEIVQEFYTRLTSQKWARLVLPSAVLSAYDTPYSNQIITLESPEQPIPVKKQEKYNIIRWALSGRNDLEINTTCYRIYRNLINRSSTDPRDWRELCYLWSSDFRTHLTETRWIAFHKRIQQYGRYNGIKRNDYLEHSAQFLKIPYIQQHTRVTEGEFYLRISNASISVFLNKRKGLSIKSCTFNDVSPLALFGSLDHGYYDDISLSADYFSGHAVIEALGEHKLTDLTKAEPSVFLGPKEDQINVRTLETSDSIFSRTTSIDENSVILRKTIHLKQRRKARIHPFIFTLNESAWDSESLWFACHNGHEHLERFPVHNKQIDHSQSFSLLITAKNGLGATRGILEIGDKNKKLIFEHDQSQSTLIPFIIFRQVSTDKVLIRLIYSAQEIDETFVEDDQMSKYEIDAQIRIRAVRKET